jgi:nicotinamide mononucleotide transporter
MSNPLEITANIVNAVSILLAARNSVHTWWTGIIGCALFMVLFYNSRLYADSLLQIFFIGTSFIGWYRWSDRESKPPDAVTRAPARAMLGGLLMASVVTVGYGYVLHRLTNAYAPFVDSSVMALSIFAQLLLMRRHYETWWIWIAVNALSVGLFTSRGLWITAALYGAFLVNATVASVSWRRHPGAQ